MDSERTFSTEQLIAFLSAVDARLSGPETIEILGGGALALAYLDRFRTRDIDLYSTPSRDLLLACERARVSTGLSVGLSRSGVAEAPEDAEDRLRRILPEFRHLRVMVLDRHDVVLSKALRGYKKDVDAILALNRRDPLDENVLVQRYLSEMKHIVGSTPRNADINFLNVINHLYGPEERDRVQDMLPERPGGPLPRAGSGRYPTRKS